MSLISLVVTLVVIGVLLWLVNTYIPMDGKIKKNPQRRRCNLRRCMVVIRLWYSQS